MGAGGGRGRERGFRDMDSAKSAALTRRRGWSSRGGVVFMMVGVVVGVVALGVGVGVAYLDGVFRLDFRGFRFAQGRIEICGMVVVVAGSDFERVGWMRFQTGSEGVGSVWIEGLWEERLSWTVLSIRRCFSIKDSRAGSERRGLDSESGWLAERRKSGGGLCSSIASVVICKGASLGTSARVPTRNDV